MPFKFIKVPINFECPITLEMMIDPVFTADGETYEREAIAEWLKKNDTSPKTNEKLEHKQLTTNRLLKGQISEFVEDNRKLFEQELIEASKIGDAETFKVLLKLKIDINAKDDNGWSALHHAAFNGHGSFLKLLKGIKAVETGVKFKFSPYKNNSALISIKEADILKIKLEIMLMNTKNQIDDNNFIMSCYSRMPSSVYRKNNYDNNYYMNEKSRFNTAFYQVSTDLNRLTLLIENIKTNPDQLYLLEQLILDYKQYTIDSYKEYLSKTGLQDVSKIYTEYQEFVKDAAREAQSYGRSPIDQGYNLEQINQSVEARKKSLASQLLRLTEFEKKIVELEYLIEHVKLQQSEDILNAKPLHLAVFKGHGLLIKELIDLGVSAEAQDDHGCTPLHWAAYQGNEKIVATLLNIKANINGQDNLGNTPLHLAVLNDAIGLADFLLEKGADYKVKNIVEQTPADVAMLNGKPGQAEFIMERGKEIQQLKKHEAAETIIAKQAEQIKNLQQEIQKLQPLEKQLQALALQVRQLTGQAAKEEEDKKAYSPGFSYSSKQQ